MKQSVITEVEHVFDPATSTMSYIVTAPGGRAAAIVDPVLDYEPKSGVVSALSAEKLLARVAERGLEVEWILETHAHADHLSSAQYLKRRLGGEPRVGISRGITSVQHKFKELLALGPDFQIDGRQFDHLFEDGEQFLVGKLAVRVIATPGHTPDSVTYVAGDAAFIGDTMFMPDYGTARCDFPGGNAQMLYQSIQRIFELPPGTRLFLCHDYPPADRQPACEVSIAAQRASNVHVRDGIGEQAFVDMRTQRDAKLAKPVLLWPSVQVNIRAGWLPEPDATGRYFLKIPLSGEAVRSIAE
jgi:glyoxylase-like metal-dependent hydrolase (beta-lactamase superfamily II)